MTSEVFECEIQVRMRDLNVGGHIDNVEVARVISEARLLFLRFGNGGAEHPAGLLDCLPDGVGELVASQTVEYRSEMFFAPFEPYLVRMWLSHIGRTSFVLATEIRTAADGAPTAVAETTQVLRDAASHSTWPITDEVRATFERYLGEPVALRSRG